MSRISLIVVVVAVLIGFVVLFARGPGYGVPQPVAATNSASPVASEPAGAPETTTPSPAATVAIPPKLAVAPKLPIATSTEHHAVPVAASTTTAEPRAVAPIPRAQSSETVMAGMHGDAGQGRSVFRKCAVCHSVMPGQNLIGPSLDNVVGRKSGTAPNFAYSDAMKNAHLTWDIVTLDAYLTDPQKVVPGNHMPFPGLKSQHDRDDVIAYLASLNSSLHTISGKPDTISQPTVPPVSTAPPNNYIADIKYTLRTGIAEGRMVYIGVGGAIDGVVNPRLTAAENQGVEITLINGEGAEHDITLPDEGAKSPRVTGKGASTTLAFIAGKPGEFDYFCSVPGHRLAGMEGKFAVTAKPPVSTLSQADISRDPADLPPPLARHAPDTVRIDLEAREVEGRLAEGTTFGYWTFNGRVPGPMLRVRVGDTVEVHLKNSPDSSMLHSVDFHATTGPGGGAAVLQVEPGGEKTMSFKALVPGLYVYHCATPMVAEHIANGMYGMILVEPEGGMSKVDHEFYVMQGEIYTDAPYGQHGSQEFSVEKLLAERPDYFVFNGEVGALSVLHQLHAKVGESVRIYFGVGGPNFTSSFHVIGEIFDTVHEFGGLISPPIHGIQTISVPPGGATIVEFTPKVPGNYTIVDHALARMERGLVGVLAVTGNAEPGIYVGKVMSGMGH